MSVTAQIFSSTIGSFNYINQHKHARAECGGLAVVQAAFERAQTPSQLRQCLVLQANYHATVSVFAPVSKIFRPERRACTCQHEL